MLYFNSPQPVRDRLTSTTMTVAIQAPAAPAPVSAAPAPARPAAAPVSLPTPQPQPVEVPKPVPPKPKAEPRQVATPVARPKPSPVSKPTVREKTVEPEQVAHKPVPQTPAKKPQDAPRVSESAPSTPTPAPPSVEPAPVMAAAPVSAPPEPRYQLGDANTPKPEYPGLATRRGWQGTVLVELLVDALGVPLKVSIKRSSGYSVLDKQALKTLSGWRLAAVSGGGEETIVVPVVFRLN
ncbi:Periplasmic protein TonB, links inner and outer membranes [Hahella chejuensis KCTC 2396]|uniref:Periplasmic protein TonB, links inner and outer membranes n=2 Tax=Hahella chejuensis TaxID=158327 RepID=Q2S7C4_HAHCH|nr:Periplasmic protein TonB, links inner and outer membranes [Hahella chejuensis KCTC 2396]